MDRPSGNVVFSNPWSTQPTNCSTQSLPCLDDDCHFRFPDHNTRSEHYITSHRYSSSWAHKKKLLRCRLCLQAFQKDDKLRLHIRLVHKPTAQELGITHEDREALIMQSRVRRQDGGSEEPSSPVPSRRNSILQSRAVRYMKRKGSQIIAPLTKKARNASIQDTGDHPTNIGSRGEVGDGR